MGGVDDRLVALRSAVFDGDGQRVAVALSRGSWVDLLQRAGGGLLVALAQGVEEAPELSRRCAMTVLYQRHFEHPAVLHVEAEP